MVTGVLRWVSDMGPCCWLGSGGLRHLHSTSSMAWKPGELFILLKQKLEARENLSTGSHSRQITLMEAKEPVITALEQRHKFYQLNSSPGSMDCTDEFSVQ